MCALEVNCAPAAWLQRTTFGFLVVDDDCSPRVELLADLQDFGGEGDVMYAVVSPLADYKRFNDTVQGFGAEHVMWNGRCFRSVDYVSEASSKLVAIDEEIKYQIVHRRRFRKTNRSTDESLDPGA